MKFLITLVFTSLVSLQVSASDTSNKNTVDSATKAEACTSCHNAIVSLKGRGVKDIINQTKNIRSNKKPHPPTGIEKLSDEEITEIAAYLDKA